MENEVNSLQGWSPACGRLLAHASWVVLFEVRYSNKPKPLFSFRACPSSSEEGLRKCMKRQMRNEFVHITNIAVFNVKSIRNGKN